MLITQEATAVTHSDAGVGQMEIQTMAVKPRPGSLPDGPWLKTLAQWLYPSIIKGIGLLCSLLSCLIIALVVSVGTPAMAEMPGTGGLAARPSAQAGERLGWGKPRGRAGQGRSGGGLAINDGCQLAEDSDDDVSWMSW